MEVLETETYLARFGKIEAIVVVWLLIQVKAEAARTRRRDKGQVNRNALQQRQKLREILKSE